MDKFLNCNRIFKQVVGAPYFVVLLVICFNAVVFQSTAIAQKPANTINNNGATAIINKDYRIGPGDVIDIVVARNDALSRNGVRVNNEGEIQLPMLDGSVSAACLTERELAGQIKERYRKYLLKPFVYVAVKEFNSKPVAFIGAVVAPGRFQLQRSVRLLELLTFVNGPSNNAGRTIQIIRDPSFSRCEGNLLKQTPAEKEEIFFYALDDTLAAKEQANPYLQPGDIVRVVEADQAYIIGNVRSATTINLNETVTLTQAIARAGGVLPDSDIEKIRVSRQTFGTLNKEPLIVNLKNINKRLEEDVVLQPNDIVEIPGEGGSKKFFKDLFRTIIPTVVNLPTRVIP